MIIILLEIEYYKERMDNLLQAGESVNELVKEVYWICKDKKQYSYFKYLLECGAEQEDIKIVNLFTLLKLANNTMKKETSSLILMAIQ